MSVIGSITRSAVVNAWRTAAVGCGATVGCAGSGAPNVAKRLTRRGESASGVQYAAPAHPACVQSASRSPCTTS